MSSKIVQVFGLRRRAALLVVLGALIGALLPSAVFAAESGASALGSPAHATGRYSRNQQHQRNDNYGHRQDYRRHDDGTNRYDNRYDKHDKGHSYCSTTYRVKRGDTLTRIARHYHVSVNAIARANNLRNPNHIYAGQHLCIP